MKKIALFILLAVLLTNEGIAQISRFSADPIGGRPMMSDAEGKPLYLKTDYKAEGSPYLYEEYCDADITTMSDQVYKGLKVKVNLLDKIFLYKTTEGVEMEITAPIKRIKFYNYTINEKSYPERILQGHLAALNAEGSPIYEVLSEDSSSVLLKKIVVTYNDSKGYGEATITRSFKKSETYFASIPPQNKELKKVEKNKSAIAALFGNKAAAVSAYIDQKKLRCKSDEDLVQVFHFYQSL